MSEGLAAPAPAAPATPANGAPRSNTGQFSPKAGATGVTPAEDVAPTGNGAPPSGPQTVAEWEGYEGEVDVYGEKQKVKVGTKAEALRAHQELLAYRKRVRDIAAAEKRIADREAMDPHELMRERGVDVNELARQRVLEAAKRIDMTPEQIKLEDAEKRLAEYEQRETERTKAEQTKQEQAQRAQMRQQAVAGLEEGLKLSGLPKTHHTMALLAEIQQECVDQRMPVLPPELLAKEAERRYNERGIEPLKKLNGAPLLARLGPEVVRAVLMAERERRGLAAGAPRQAVPASPRELDAPEPSKTYDVGEAEARLRAMRNRG